MDEEEPRRRRVRAQWVVLAIAGVLVLLWGSVRVIEPMLTPDPPAIEHQTSEDLDITAPQKLDSVGQFDEFAADWDHPDALRLVAAENSLVAVTEDGVFGVGYPGGEERWHFRVPEQKVAVSFTSGGGTVRVAYRVDGLQSDEVHYAVLNPETGVRWETAIDPIPMPSGGLSSLPDAAYDRTNFTFEENPLTLAGEQPTNDDEEDDIWRVGLAAYCDGAEPSRNDVEVATSTEKVFVSILCPGAESSVVFALDPESGDFEWGRELAAAGVETPPELLVVDYDGLYRGKENDPLHRVLSGEFGTDYLYLRGPSGASHEPRLWNIEGMDSWFLPPNTDGNPSPQAVVVGRYRTIDRSAAVQAANLLVGADVMRLEDFPELMLVDSSDGTPRLPTIDELPMGSGVGPMMLESIEEAVS